MTRGGKRSSSFRLPSKLYNLQRGRRKRRHEDEGRRNAHEEMKKLIHQMTTVGFIFARLQSHIRVHVWWHTINHNMVIKEMDGKRRKTIRTLEPSRCETVNVVSGWTAAEREKELSREKELKR